jgi:hypothetical protein
MVLSMMKLMVQKIYMLSLLRLLMQLEGAPELPQLSLALPLVIITILIIAFRICVLRRIGETPK